MLWSRVSFRLSVRQAVSRVILRGCALVNSLFHPIWAQHIIACADCLFLFLDLGPVQVGDLSFHRLDGADLVHGLDMEADNLAGFHVQKIR